MNSRRRFLITTLAAVLVPATAAGLTSEKQQLQKQRTRQTLSQLQQQRNQLILQQNTGQGIQFGQQMSNLNASKDALDSRNTGFVTITEDAMLVDGVEKADHDPGLVREKYQMPDSGFVIVIIDSRGKELLRSTTPVSAQRVLTAIDDG